ncbi:MAG: hypothetical protein V4667_06650 [Bacteroidota bacterium]
MKKNKIQLLLFSLLLIFIGFLREYLFVSINLRIQQIYYNSNENVNLIPDWIQYISHLNYSELLILKWVLTFIFIVAFWLVAILIFKKFSFDKKDIKLFSIVLVTLLIASLLFYWIGDSLFNKEYFGYKIARSITGFLQSPLPILIYIAFVYSIKKQSKH